MNNISLKPKYLFEGKRYSTIYIEEHIDKEFVEKLKANRICREEKNQLIFCFVGLIVYKNKYLFVFPKYIDYATEDEILSKKMKLICQLLNKYGIFNSTYDNTDFLINNIEDKFISTFAISRFLLEDYLRNGYYSKKITDVGINEDGEIIWEKTVSEINPYYVKGVPYYLDTFNTRQLDDETNIIIHIHKWAISYCTEAFAYLQGIDNLDFERMNVDLAEIGEVEYLVNVLERELQITFLDEKMILLKALIALIKKRTHSKLTELDIYGTREFEYIWEKVCGYVFDNEISQYENFLEKPKWTDFNAMQLITKKTFRPDIIKTYIDIQRYFLILDAKYYNIRFKEGDLKGNPGVNDIAKQLLYEQALSAYTKGSITRNMFLFPYDKDELFDVFGNANLDFMKMDPVILVFLSADKIYKSYLNEDVFTLDEYRQLEAKILKSKCLIM
ncbi:MULTISPECIES: LlaJI family restriction endonuclease [Bacillus]|uniref:Type II restriction-modification system restriction subunit n=2 Tax=Bacillus cereus TaxID=1396 RepID=Q81H81_BACCR|nr:LlaJI family restriction endonuclease [Bacillus cereus]AAP07927.1 Type II restriction-modification system restriction subunit [Bacillus cereus ATCC 14579]ETT82802.1 Type II restriction-modification system restriction subunit [Bacillus cereus]KZD74515.1 hypothetical protein B4155_5004 [Bacillus cereus]MCC3286489.1 LlaJI family restriction endonuclease [Bacillus cereus]MEB9992745.1 LlaJI family restriction endonuclease [Bacillus cereus]